MQVIKTVKNVMYIAIITGFLVSTINIGAAVITAAEEISPEEQKKLDYKLFDAIDAGIPQAIRDILNEGANPNARNRLGHTPLHAANQITSINTLETMPILILAGADLNAQSHDLGRTALHYAIPRMIHESAVNRKLKILDTLINEQVDLNVQDGDGNTALIWAIKFCDLRTMSHVLQSLIEAGADETIKNNRNHTALDLARAHADFHDIEWRLELLTKTLEKRYSTIAFKLQEHLRKGPRATFPSKMIEICTPTDQARKRAIAATVVQRQRAGTTRVNALALRAARLLKK